MKVRHGLTSGEVDSTEIGKCAKPLVSKLSQCAAVIFIVGSDEELQLRAVCLAYGDGFNFETIHQGMFNGFGVKLNGWSVVLKFDCANFVDPRSIGAIVGIW